jgi:hypothetical protein
MITIKHEKYGDITFDNGTSREEITNYLVELEAKSGEQFGTLETIGHQAGRSIGSSVRGIKSWLGVDGELAKYEDEQAELKSRIMMEQNPVASVTGMLGGGFLDPVTLPALALKPLTFASKVGTYASRGAAQGIFGGVLEPVYEQYGDSLALNIMSGATLGGALGAGIGKLLTPKISKSAEDKSEDLSKTSKEAITDVGSTLGPPVRTVETALEEIQKELELSSKGAPSKQELASLKKEVASQRGQIAQIDHIITKMGGGKLLGTKIAGNKLEAQKIELKRSLQDLELKYAEGVTLRNAATELEHLRKGRTSAITGFDERLKAKSSPFKPTPMAAAIKGNGPKPTSNPPLFRKLGIEDASPKVGVDVLQGRARAISGQLGDPAYKTAWPSMRLKLEEINRDIRQLGGVEVVGITPKAAPVRNAPLAGETGDSAGSNKVTLETSVGAQFMPRTAHRPEVTQKLLDGKMSGENRETSLPIYQSTKSKEAKSTIDRRFDRGEEPTQKEWDDYDYSNQEAKVLEEYRTTAAKIAGSRSLDIAALRFKGGRYTFANIEKSAASFIKKNGIKNLSDMVKYIQDNPDKIFEAKELKAVEPLLMEMEARQLKTHQLLSQVSAKTDPDMAALLHADINLYAGINAWFKGQGSKASAAMNFRRKIYQDIADNREIESLFAGVKC